MQAPQVTASPARPASTQRFGAAYFGFAFALAAVLAPQAFGGAAWSWALAAGFALVALGGGAWMLSLGRRGRSCGPLIALATLQTLLVTPELGLRSAGYQHLSGIQFGYPHPEDFWELELDDELFWKLPHPSPLSNSLGFFGPEPALPKPADVRRLVMLGDSCSQQDHPFAWPEIAARELSRELAQPFECVNLALSGYSTHQGLRVAQRWLAKLEPDLVAVYYGWNDHWLARGAIDSQKGPAIAFERLYRSSALLQATRAMLVASGGLAEHAQASGANRVPLDEYTANLGAIVALARECGARVVLLTAPSTHDLAVPPYLLRHGFQRDAAAVVDEHRRYNQALREFARRHEVLLLDLDAQFAAREDRATLFLEDGIHFSAAGRIEVARIFREFVRARGLAQ
jgi:lysophospholipase L1-like esterase